jgi:hypothetical protein
MKRNQICSNKGPDPLQRGDDYKNVEMGWGYLKISSSRTTLPIYPDLTQIILRWGIQVYSNEGVTLFQER